MSKKPKSPRNTMIEAITRQLIEAVKELPKILTWEERRDLLREIEEELKGEYPMS